MEQTFITVHDISPDARITFASASIEQILGYRPEEVYMRSSFDFFHPDEVPFARRVHNRGLRLDKAAVLHYARLRGKDGRWIGCECCFTVVYNVLVACISLYRRGTRSEQRAKDAPLIRRLFSCSPRDPRYHMLEYLSPKFTSVPVEREPRGALILNRFSRNLTIMHATFAVDSILGGRTLEEIRGSSFYDYIEDECVPEAERCLESAKSNDSIAYLRFWVKGARVPAQAEPPVQAQAPDIAMNDDDESDPDSDNGGVRLSSVDVDGRRQPNGSSQQNGHEDGSNSNGGNNQQIVAARDEAGPSNAAVQEEPQGIEVEAVVSCASDGLVVILRKARPLIPSLQQPQQPPTPNNYHHGLFAAPWGREIIRPHVPLDQVHQFRAPLRPEYMPLREPAKAGGPPDDQFMMAIKDVAVFAWALVGINGNFAKYCKGAPQGESQPPDGFPVWDPSAGDLEYQGPENQAALRWARLGKAAQRPMGAEVPYGSYASDSQFGTAPGMYQVPQGYVERHTYMHSIQHWPQNSASPYTFGQQQHQHQQQPHPQQYQQQEEQYHQQQRLVQSSQREQAPRGLWSPQGYVRDGASGQAWQQYQPGQGGMRTPSSVPQNGSSSSSGQPTTKAGDSGYSTQNEFRWQ